MARKRQTTFPSRIVTLAVATTCSPLEGSADTHVRRPRLIVSRHSRIEAGRNGRIQTFTGATGKAWASWLCERLRYEGVTWVVACRLGDLLREIAFFRLVDDDLFSLVPPGQESPKRGPHGQSVAPLNPLALVEDSPTAIKAFTASGQKLLLCDLRNWIDCDLDALAASVGIKRTTPIPPPGPGDETVVALTLDLEIQERAFLAYLAWLKSRGVRDFRLTAGGQAMSYYKMRHRKIRPTYDAEPEVRILERAGLWGGKVQARYVGHLGKIAAGPRGTILVEPAADPEETPGELYHLDATGLYASLMQQKLFPHQLVEWSTEPAEPWIGPPHWGRDLVASVVVESAVRTYPVKDGRRTLWATGRFRTTLAGPELARAIRHREVREWGLYARYRMDDLFSSYISELWALRQHARTAGNAIFERVAKTLINSLWGKFAAKTPRWTETADPGFGEQWGVFHHVDGTSGTVTKYRALAGLYQREDKPEDAPDAYPAVSAWLTSYGRTYLDELVAIAGHRDVYYTAVDALVTSELGFYNLCQAGVVEPNTLGKLRVTGKHRVGNFAGYNRYYLDGVAHASGLKTAAVEVADGVYRQVEGGRLVPALLSGERDGLIVKHRLIDFRRNVVYGKVGHDGWVTPPVVAQAPF